MLIFLCYFVICFSIRRIFIIRGQHFNFNKMHCFIFFLLRPWIFFVHVTNIDLAIQIVQLVSSAHTGVHARAYSDVSHIHSLLILRVLDRDSWVWESLFWTHEFLSVVYFDCRLRCRVRFMEARKYTTCVRCERWQNLIRMPMWRVRLRGLRFTVRRAEHTWLV